MSEPIKAVDFLRQPLAVDDRVAYCEIGYRNLVKGTITRITPKFVMIKNDRDRHSTVSETCKQEHKQVIRIDDIEARSGAMAS